MTRILACFGLFLGSMLSHAATLYADEHEPKQVEGMIREFYRALSEGEFQAAYSHLMLGATGYMPAGLLHELEGEASRKKLIDDAEEAKEAGFSMEIQPRYVSVEVHGATAVATFLTESALQFPNGEGGVLAERVTHVWIKTGDDWKLAHFHISPAHANASDDAGR